MVTEREARDMLTAIELFQASDAQAETDQRVIDIATATQWFRANVTILWRSSQTLRQQLNNTFTDLSTMRTLNESMIRQIVINENIDTAINRVRTIKANL